MMMLVMMVMMVLMVTTSVMMVMMACCLIDQQSDPADPTWFKARVRRIPPRVFYRHMIWKYKKKCILAF